MTRWIIRSVCMIILAFSFMTVSAFAETDDSWESITIQPSGDTQGLSDYREFRFALSLAQQCEGVTIDLLPGTYYIGGIGDVDGSTKGALEVFSNTIINANGATVRQLNPGKGILKTNSETTQAGYNALTNVTINGGTWLGNASDKGETCSLFKFYHASDITLNGVTMKDVYSGHLLEFAGCKNCTIRNCYFGGSCPGTTTRNEAVELDNVTKGCINLPSGHTEYDNLACQDITFENNTVVFPRTFGSHYTYGKGSGQFNTRIHVRNNKLRSTLNEGLIIYNWYDSDVSGNTIEGKTAGIDIYTYTKGATADADYAGAPVALSKNNSKPFNVVVSNNNVITKKGTAMWIRGCAERPVSGITVKGNKFQSKEGNTSKVNAPVRVYFATKKGGKGVTLKSNTVTGIKKKHGIYVFSAKYVTLDGNKVSVNNKKTENGIYIANGAHNCVVKNNVVKGNGKTKNGIHVSKSRGTKVTANKVSKFKQYGIYINKCKKTSATRNVLTSCKKAGIRKAKGSKITIKGNRFKSCKKKILK